MKLGELIVYGGTLVVINVICGLSSSTNTMDLYNLLERSWKNFEDRSQDEKRLKDLKEEFNRLSERLKKKSVFGRAFNIRELREDIEDFYRRSIISE